MPIASVAKINAFLLECKQMVSSGRFSFVRRVESMQTLALFGLETTDVSEILMLLSIANYAQGPKGDKDPDFSGSMYVFGYELENTELYIKLKCEKERGCVCISFHPVRWPLTYPYRKGDEKS